MTRITSIVAAALISVAAVTQAGDVSIDGTYRTTAGTGTPPLEISSTTHVPNLNADLLDSMSSADFAPVNHLHAEYTEYVRTVIVSPYLDGGGNQDPIQSGQKLLAALAAITTATEVNPYLVKLEPGIYDLDYLSLSMKEWVDIEGSGRHMTTIPVGARCRGIDVTPTPPSARHRLLIPYRWRSFRENQTRRYGRRHETRAGFWSGRTSTSPTSGCSPRAATTAS